jgi:hypothetical protein
VYSDKCIAALFFFTQIPQISQINVIPSISQIFLNTNAASGLSHADSADLADFLHTIDLANTCGLVPATSHR